jgi:hypothetical protein
MEVAANCKILLFYRSYNLRFTDPNAHLYYQGSIIASVQSRKISRSISNTKNYRREFECCTIYKESGSEIYQLLNLVTRCMESHGSFRSQFPKDSFVAKDEQEVWSSCAKAWHLFKFKKCAIVFKTYKLGGFRIIGQC